MKGATIKRMPTRIVCEPVKELCQGRVLKVYTCDDGKNYSLKELAEIIGVTPQRLNSRLATMGWQDPRFFDPNKQAMKEMSKIGNPEWANLGSRPRSENLRRLPRLGRFDYGDGQ